VTSYIIRRLLWTIPTLLVISAISFFLMHAVPGGPFAGPDLSHLAPEVIENLNRYYHLDEPVWKQYLDYVWNAVRGDLGPSYLERSRSVNDIIASTCPSPRSWPVRAGRRDGHRHPAGIVSALRQNRAADYLGMFVAISGVSVPEMTLVPC